MKMETPPCHVRLKDVSLRFRRYEGYSQGIKEAVTRWVSPPEWYKVRPPRTSEFWGLTGINLDLKTGDRLGVIGQNGAGKSSLLKVVSRVYKPTKGSVDVVGRLAPLIEIGAGFSPELTGRENALLNGAILGIPKRVMAERLDDVFAFSELSDFRDTPVKYYSTGMHLKLAFTIATEINPDILILDELYAGGDESFIEKANVRLDRFVEISKILILVAHNMDYIRRFCNRVIVLQAGRIVADGAPEEMVERYLAYSHGDLKALDHVAVEQ